MALDESCRLQARLSIETRTNAFQVRTGEFDDDQISVYFTIRQYWGNGPDRSFLDSFPHQRQVGEEIVRNQVVPRIVQPAGPGDRLPILNPPGPGSDDGHAATHPACEPAQARRSVRRPGNGPGPGKARGKDVVELEIGDSPYPDDAPCQGSPGCGRSRRIRTGYGPSLGLARASRGRGAVGQRRVRL